MNLNLNLGIDMSNLFHYHRETHMNDKSNQN